MPHTPSASPRARTPSPWQAVRAEAVWIARAARRAWREPGRERDLAVQSGKAALAAVLAWLAASWLLPDAFALMAPWVAVVLVQATVYRSVRQGLHQTLAITTGTVLAAALVIPFGHPLLTMLVVLPVTTLLGNWPRFGDQGIYTSTAALFTLVPGEATLDSTVSRILATLLGTAIGIAVNALILPPVYLRSTHKAVDDVVREAREIVAEIADGLDEPWEYDRVRGWYERAHRLPRAIRGVHAALGWSRESLRLNPDRRRRAELARLDAAYDETLTTLENIASRLIGLTYTLVEAAADEVPRPSHAVTRPYAGFLHQVAGALEAYGRVVTGDAPETARTELREAVDEARATQDRLRAELPRHAGADPGRMAVFGTLLAEARRLTGSLTVRED
ncbi:FUSC family protein [Streptomyces megasporus]|uniref:FUSC family protein n=1 Tax=Streptomyces megasporus TaxID=44060 RepID=UPI00068FA865|nr:aromatic acid exporter family protein [Streptomyces megasporus]